MAYRLRSFAGDDSPVNIEIKAGNKKQARKKIRALFPNDKVKFSLDRVYVGGHRKLFYQRVW